VGLTRTEYIVCAPVSLNIVYREWLLMVVYSRLH
jgi:hypothetical protein